MRIKNFIRHQVAPLLAMLLVLGSFKSAVADWNIVPTGSMNPTIVEGDRIFVNKLAYGLKVPFTTWHVARWSEPQRGDVGGFNSPADGTRLVKRVVGLPGDTIAMQDDHLLINGAPATYSGATTSGGQVIAAETIERQSHPVLITPALPAMRKFGPVTVPAGCY